METFNEAYFERGIAEGISCYENYRWIPELTISLAMTYVDFLGLKREDSILDFGAAKGFIVRALRLLYRDAWGCDISHYAIESSDAGMGSHLKLCENCIVPFEKKFDWIIAKDVFEHIDEDQIQYTLKELRNSGKQMFAIIPLGENDKFIIPAYHRDITHKLAKTPDWWKSQFIESGWKTKSFTYRVPGIKDNWAAYPAGNGFFINE